MTRAPPDFPLPFEVLFERPIPLCQCFRLTFKMWVVLTSMLIEKCFCALGWQFPGLDKFYFSQSLTYFTNDFFLCRYKCQLKCAKTRGQKSIFSLKCTKKSAVWLVLNLLKDITCMQANIFICYKCSK